MKTTSLLASLVSLLLVPALASAQGGLAGLLKSASDAVSDAADNLSDAVTDAASDVSQTLSGIAGGKPKAGAASGKAAAAAADDAEDASEPAAASSGSFSFGKPKAADPANLVTVEAKGQGESVEAAKRDAVRNAIKKAVGELVDAKTLVENDELVKDNILTLSNAMVEKADYGDAKSVGDGLFEIPVTAVVKKGRLNKELEKIGIATGAVKGDSLAASLFSGKERVANAEKFFGERLKDFPGNVVEAVMLTKDDGSPNIELEDGHVYANVGLRVNMENYLEWTRQLQEVLDAVCLERESRTLAFAQNDDRRQQLGVPPVGNAKIDAVKRFPKKKVFSSTKRDDVGDPCAILVMIATPSSKKVNRGSWPAAFYYIDYPIWFAFAKQLDATFPKFCEVSVSLKDGDGDPVCSATSNLSTAKQLHNSNDTISGTIGGMTQSVRFPDGVGFAPVYAKFDMQYPYGASVEEWAAFAPAIGIDFAIAPNSSYTRNGLYCYRTKDMTMPIRLDLGEVSEDDLAEVESFEVKVEYK